MCKLLKDSKELGSSRSVSALIILLVILVIALAGVLAFPTLSRSSNSDTTTVATFVTTQTQTVTRTQTETQVSVSISPHVITQTSTDDVINSVTVNMTDTTTSTDSVVVAVTTLPASPFNYTAYLENGGSCGENNFATACWIESLPQAEVFNCLTQAATPSGCTQEVPSTPTSFATETEYPFTIWYPYVNASSGEPSWANCRYNYPGNSAPSWAFCITISPTAFLVSIAGPGPN
jgi:hypothetical protein